MKFTGHAITPIYQGFSPELDDSLELDTDGVTNFKN